MQHPLVSVIIPTYNRERYLREAVASVLAQTYQQWELVIVDDGSSDGTRAFLATLDDPRISSILLPRGKGGGGGNAAIARNVGARAARGTWLAFLDSDDCWLPEKLARQVEITLARPECRWSYVGHVCVDEGGRELAWAHHHPWIPYDGWVLEHVVRSRVFVATSAALVERRLFESLGGMDEALVRCQDTDLWLRLADASPVAALPDMLVRKRLHAGDRGTKSLDVQTYMNRIYEGVLRRANVPRIRRLGLQMRARVNVEIANSLRATSRYSDARRALRVAFAHAWWYPGWWVSLAKTVLRPVLRAPRSDQRSQAPRSRPISS